MDDQTDQTRSHSAVRPLGRLHVPMTVQLADNRPVRRDAMLCVVGNVGKLRGNVTLSPCARPDDGVLDRNIAPPRRFWRWIKLALRLIDSAEAG
jgi:diacylglycerol kinase (ATP)